MTTNGDSSSASSTSAPPAWVPIAISTLIGLVTIYLLTDIFFVEVMIGLFVDGAILLAYLAAACGWGWMIVGQSPARIITSTAIGLGVMGLLTLFLGLSGLYSIYTAVGLVAIGMLFLLPELRDRVSERARDKTKTLTPTATRESSHASMGKGAGLWWLVPFSLVLAAALVSASIMPGFLWKPLDPHPYDAMSYHLQVPRQWYDAGRIIPLGNNAFSYFPMAMETHYLAAMTLRGGPWAGMYLCQMMTLAHGVITIVAVVQIARALGATSIRAWSGALVVASVPWVFQLSTVAYVETGVMLYTTLAVGWMMLAIREPTRRGWLIVGLCAGLACGMKYTAIPMTAVLVVGIACVHELTKRRFANAAVVAFACAIVASPWLVRNIAWTGNPVFPLATSVFGQAHFTDEQFERYRVAHRPPEAESGAAARVSNGWSRTAVDPQFGYVALFAGAFAVASLVIRKPRADGVVLAIMLIGMLGIWLGATHVMPRFITPIIPLLGLAIALVPVPGIAAVTVALTQFGIGLWLIWGWLSPELSGDRRVLLRLSDPSRLLPDDIERALRSDRPIALIGDAQAFWYPISSDRLIYRSVFDVRIAPGTPLVDGWLGESVESLRKRGAWVIINTPELTRLSQTYRHLPAPLPPFDQPVPGPIVLPPG